jgi:hypothetical protein
MLGLSNQSIRHLCQLIAVFLLASFFVLFSSNSHAEQDAVLIQAETLIRQADYKAAYQLLEPL